MKRMLRTIFLYCIAGIFCLGTPRNLFAANDPVPLSKGMVISHSVSIKRSIYKLNAGNSLQKSVIAIKGNNIVVDFNGAVLEGNIDSERPDKFNGVALYITGTHITIKNAVIRGYKIAILGRHLHDTRIENCDLSYNYRQHLNSNRQWEDVSDWQSYHHNENDEWMRYGAGIYLRDCDSMTIRDNLITGGQCGLMMTNCDKGTIYNNNFSFNSGIGIGLYRSSYNRVFNNKLDWNVRGVSYGVYYRGQDAAAILVYEQSSHNVFAYNSATHSGDGFFLWAGASTMNTGDGGCNDNLIYGNDFSYAPTNGVEVTFSQNRIIRNKIYDCDNGIWGGYSYQTLIIGNSFKNNNTGIAIEQGQDNTIQGNSFDEGRTGIHLWATPGRTMEGQYTKKRDVRSMNYELKNNSLSGLGTAVEISHSEKITIRNNRISDPKDFIKLDSSAKDILISNNGADHTPLGDKLWGERLAPEKIVGARDAMLAEDHLKGKQYIMMTDWGPYDFRSPILWRTKTDNTGKIYFDIIGPKGTWKLKNAKGVTNLSANSGEVPGHLTAQETERGITDVAINLEYTGAGVVSPFGKKFSAGEPYIFSYKKFELPIDWQVKLFTFDTAADPVKHERAFKDLIAGAPVKTAIVHNLDTVYRLMRDLPTSNIVTVAMAKVEIPKGIYRIGITAGDVARVYIDNKLIIDSWDPSKIVYDADYHLEAVLPLKGKHVIRIVQAQYNYGMLMFTLHPVEEYN